MKQAVEDPTEREAFAPLLQPMMACLAATLNMGAEASAQDALSTFIERECVVFCRAPG
jgi:DNA-binding transcriptional regulator YbjK